jgi:hypothetical protein
LLLLLLLWAVLLPMGLLPQPSRHTGYTLLLLLLMRSLVR